MRNAENQATLLEEVSSVDVGDQNVVGTTFVVPIEAALPAEIEQLEYASGSLYERLAALDKLPAGQDFGIVLISGQELVDIAASWSALSVVKKVAVLLDLPGVRYNTLFTLGYKQAGLQTIAWPSVAEGLANRVRTKQRVVDSQPFVAPVLAGVPGAAATASGLLDDVDVEE